PGARDEAGRPAARGLVSGAARIGADRLGLLGEGACLRHVVRYQPNRPGHKGPACGTAAACGPFLSVVRWRQGGSPMPQDPAGFRPKAYPPPEFPPRRAARFAKVPPAIFPPILGAIGLVLALRRGLAALHLPVEPADFLAGLVLALWAFAAFAYAAKLARRPGVLWEDLRVLPGRAGLASATAGALAAAALLVPFAPGAARVLLFGGLGLHAALALAILAALARMPAEARGVTPVWHLSFVGFIMGGLAAVPLGHETLAQGLFWATLPVAAAIWGISLAQLLRRVPPAPLRPLLAIHVAPAALFSLVAGALGQPG